MKTAGEGGPWGMAVLANYMLNKKPGQSLEDYLDSSVFGNQESFEVAPSQEDIDGFAKYIELYKKGLDAEKAAAEI